MATRQSRLSDDGAELPEWFTEHRDPVILSRGQDGERFHNPDPTQPEPATQCPAVGSVEVRVVERFRVVPIYKPCGRCLGGGSA